MVSLTDRLFAVEEVAEREIPVNVQRLL